MPLGSSSAAPVIKPGPSFSRTDSAAGEAERSGNRWLARDMQSADPDSHVEACSVKERQMINRRYPAKLRPFGIEGTLADDHRPRSWLVALRVRHPFASSRRILPIDGHFSRRGALTPPLPPRESLANFQH